MSDVQASHVTDPRNPSAGSLDLSNVSVESFSANLRRLGEIRGISLKIVQGWATGDSGHILVRTQVECLLFDTDSYEDSEDSEEKYLLARLRCRVVADYHAQEGIGWNDFFESDRGLEFMRSEALTEVFPYLREAVSSMASRLGFRRLTLGKYRPNESISFSTGA
jgi:hypothetical protein